MERQKLLTVSGLKVSFTKSRSEIQAVRGVSFQLNHGEILGIVGESGCGKSVTGQAMLGLIPSLSGPVIAGSVKYRSQELLGMKESELAKIRGKKIGIVFQDPALALNPLMKAGKQIVEAIRVGRKLPQKKARLEALTLLEMIGIDHPTEIFERYPHELSGGLGQRVLIAIALAGRPEILLADEPTAALDTVAKVNLASLLQKLRENFKLSIIFLTHDLVLVARLCHRVLVMYAGLVVEEGTAADIFHHPRHPYLRGLLQCLPQAARENELAPIMGQPADPAFLPPGCAFAPRCPERMAICQELPPGRLQLAAEHFVSCWRFEPGN
jgi:peptide/nickel transport system ATP-binding protein/oligopeptide transport system ATP-binding protein